MKICFDTCVIIDIFEQSDFFMDSFASYDIAQIREDDVLVSLHSTADIDYILHRRGLTKDQAQTAVLQVLEMFDPIDLIPADIIAAAGSTMPDYEDALIAFSAKRAGVDFIITRDSGFLNSPVPILTPAQFVKQYCPEGYKYDLINIDLTEDE